MTEPALETLQLDDIRMRVATQGSGPLVLFCHDWGAPTVWNAALMRPDLFRAVVGMSVPFAPSGRVDLLTALEKQGIDNFYMQYFQAPGVAEAEFERDVEATIRRVHFSGSGDAPVAAAFGMLAPGTGFSANALKR